MIDIHAIEFLNGGVPSNPDRLKAAILTVANAAGSGAGAAVTVAVAFAEPMPAAYQVFCDAGQDVVCYASAKTVNGFTLNINPRLAANTVAAGNVNLLVLA
jgi:hypothetical protein